MVYKFLNDVQQMRKDSSFENTQTANYLLMKYLQI
jgi:hypothetical protein